MNHHNAPIGDELLSAWLDDELPAPDRERVAAALEVDPGLVARLAALRFANELTRQHARDIDRAPLSPALRALLQDAPEPAPGNAVNHDTPVTTAHQATLLPWHSRIAAWRGFQPLSLAASLVLAVVLSYSVLQPSDDPELALHAALLEQVASGESLQLGDLALNPRFSFVGSQGQACRVYRVSGPSVSSDEIACRSERGWDLQVSVPAMVQGDDQYLPAGSNVSALDSTLDALMSGAPLSLEAERELMLQGWTAAGVR